MKGDPPPAALRLLTSLPVRTNYRPEPLPQHKWRARQKAVGQGKGATDRKAINVDGVDFASLSDARKALGVGHMVLRRWLDEGRAKLI
jgi:hypothetical protein